MANPRDRTTWTVLELTRTGERAAEDGLLDGELRRLLSLPAAWPVFVPVRAYEEHGKRVALHLMEGYAFVSTGVPMEELTALVWRPHSPISAVLATAGASPVPLTLTDAKIRQLRRQLAALTTSESVAAGDQVEVLRGPYGGLTGDVVKLRGKEDALVHIKLRSLNVEVQIPTAFFALGMGSNGHEHRPEHRRPPQHPPSPRP